MSFPDTAAGQTTANQNSAAASLHPVHASGRGCVVAVAGEIDMATAPALQAALMNALALHTPEVLDVDLSACTFMDCAGLRVLLAVRTAASAAGCQMWVSHPQHMVHLVLQVTNLLEIFTPTGQPAQQPLGLHWTGQVVPAARAEAA